MYKRYTWVALFLCILNFIANLLLLLNYVRLDFYTPDDVAQRDQILYYCEGTE